MKPSLRIILTVLVLALGLLAAPYARAESTSAWRHHYKRSLWLQSHGRAQAALAEAKRALALALSQSGFDSLDAADARTLVGFCQYVRKEYSQAELSYREALRVVLEKESLGDARSVEIMNDLVYLYEDSGESEKARSTVEEVVKAVKLSGGRDDLRLADEYKIQGDLERALQNFDAAEQVYSERLRIITLNSGPSHVLAASAINDLAGNAQEAGDYLKAARRYEATLQILIQAGQGLKETTAMTMNNLAVSYALAGHSEEAKRWYREALGILLRSGHVGLEDEAVRSVLRNATQSILTKNS